jgi:hypothetical protein
MGIDRQPAVASWELWTVANMLLSTRGEAAEAHAEEQLASAREHGDEAGEIVWNGVLTKLAEIRRTNLVG